LSGKISQDLGEGENPMLVARLSTALILVLFCICSQAQEQVQKKMTVTGNLSRTMAIGGESTGWAIQLESETTIDGHQVSSIEIDYPKTGKLEKLNSKRVTAIGAISHRQGVETGERPVLVVSSIREAKATTQPAPANTVPFKLSGSEWLLEDLGGSGVLDRIQATLAFPEAGKVAGNGSCNRFFGPAAISGYTIKFGPLVSSRMACPEAVMNQESKYLDALQAAERFEWKDSHLLIYCKDFEKPLRFTRMQAPKPTAP
jgi:heat shock protein HslJ